jgi:hypothetical protein
VVTRHSVGDQKQIFGGIGQDHVLKTQIKDTNHRRSEVVVGTFRAAQHTRVSVMMDREEYDRQIKELEEFAKSEGAWYYDPESPVVWKQYIIGPVRLWRRILWWFFPPSHVKMHRIMARRNDQLLGWSFF